MWDLGMRRCFETIGPEHQNMNARKNSTFHRDSITSMEMNFENELLFTGGRDGSIFRSALSEAK